MFKLGKLMLGALLIFHSSFTLLSAHYCPKCVKIETEREIEQAKASSKPPQYYEDYLSSEKQPSEEEVNTTDSAAASSISLSSKEDRAFNWLQSGSKLMALAVNTEETNKLKAVNQETSSLSNKTDLNQPTIPSNPSTENQSPPSPAMQVPFSTIFDILTIKNLFNVFEEPFTIFAPSDEAIRSFPSSFVQNILKPENRELLFAFITNHIVPKQILRQDFNTSFKTLGGRIVEIKMGENGLTVNEDAKILKSAPLGNGGILYVIDKVLIPIHE